MTHESRQAVDEDRELVVRASDGDERAFGRLVERHHASVYRVALRIGGGNETLAADAAQDTFFEAFRALGDFRGESAFRSWLLTIAANQTRDLLRKRSRRRETALDAAPALESPGPDPAERAVVADEAARARAWLERLPEKQRLAVTLRLEEGLSFREVGEVIGSSEGAARVNYHHGINKLRDWMIEKEGTR